MTKNREKNQKNFTKNSKTSKNLKNSRKFQKWGQRGVQKSTPARGPKRGQKSLFLTIPRHMRVTKGVFDPFRVFGKIAKIDPK